MEVHPRVGLRRRRGRCRRSRTAVPMRGRTLLEAAVTSDSGDPMSADEFLSWLSVGIGRQATLDDRLVDDLSLDSLALMDLAITLEEAGASLAADDFGPEATVREVYLAYLAAFDPHRRSGP